MDNFCVGNVLAIEGNKIKIIMKQNTNMFSYFFNGKTYQGVSIDQYIAIIRGPYKIVAKVEKEYLNDNLKDANDHSYSVDRFQRIVEVSVIGYFYEGKFKFGIKCLPMIYNEVVLLSNEEITEIFGELIVGPKNKKGVFINIGQSLKEDLPINLDINNLFNTHIGIFGNTGSGKSNTLTKLYTELFLNENLSIFPHSKFVILDFNGEYTGKDIFVNDNTKTTINLKTNCDDGDKIKISSKRFWTTEIISTLFSATEKTQQPFIQNMIDFYKLADDNINLEEKVKHALKTSVSNLIHGNNNKEMLNLLRELFLMIFNNDIWEETTISKLLWHGTSNSFYLVKTSNMIHGKSVEEKQEIIEQAYSIIDNKWNNKKTTTLFDDIIIFFNAQLIFNLSYNYSQFEFISPLLRRVSELKTFLERTITLSNENYNNLTIISFKNCNQKAKQILPLLISKELYDEHIQTSIEKDEINKTCHLIIDEAHNILSEQITREAESFKDYRLDVFEKIIKEGRKFGFYLTISSQRPYDISATIISQLHNYFIHRLVNDLDLKMIANTISSLDYLSKQQIPNLAPGQCIITGTSFEMPIFMQVDKLDKELSPKSENADLLKVWKNEKE